MSQRRYDALYLLYDVACRLTYGDYKVDPDIVSLINTEDGATAQVRNARTEQVEVSAENLAHGAILRRIRKEYESFKEQFPELEISEKEFVKRRGGPQVFGLSGPMCEVLENAVAEISEPGFHDRVLDMLSASQELKDWLGNRVEVEIVKED